MATFPLFSKLPAELRTIIWEFTVERRTVELSCIVHKPSSGASRRRSSPILQLTSSTPIPGTLHACRESRGLGVYTPVMLDPDLSKTQRLHTERRYVWINLDLDVISVGSTRLEDLISIAYMIKELELDRKGQDESWYHFESSQLGRFTNLKKVHIICRDDSMEQWWGSSEAFYWSCGDENVILSDPDTGETMTLRELEDREDRFAEETSRLQDPTSQVRYRNGFMVEGTY